MLEMRFVQVSFSPCNLLRLGIFNNSDGTVPVSSVVSNCNAESDEHNPSSEGMGPEISLCARRKYSGKLYTSAASCGVVDHHGDCVAYLASLIFLSWLV